MLEAEDALPSAFADPTNNYHGDCGYPSDRGYVSSGGAMGYRDGDETSEFDIPFL